MSLQSNLSLSLNFVSYWALSSVELAHTFNPTNLTTALPPPVDERHPRKNQAVETVTQFQQVTFDSVVWGNTFVGGMNTSVTQDPVKYEDVLKVNYPAGSFGVPEPLDPNATVTKIQGGAQFFARPFSDPVKRALLEYDVYFPPGFAFNYGGKLPGLYGTPEGADPTLECIEDAADGSNCWSLLLMWRPNGFGEVSTHLFKVYAMLPEANAKNLCDTKLYPLNICNEPPAFSLGRTSFQFQIGTWYSVGLYVQVNEPGKTDGYMQIYINGTLMNSVENLVFRNPQTKVSSLLISDVAFNSYFGGNTSSWAPRADTSALFRNLKLSLSQAPKAIRNTASKQSVSVLMIFLLIATAFF